LQRIGLQKGLFSSPAAALESTIKRIELLTGKNAPTADGDAEPAGLHMHKNSLQDLLNIPAAGAFNKFQRLNQFLRSAEFGWQINNASDRLVIFSERIGGGDAATWPPRRARRYGHPLCRCNDSHGVCRAESA
jgi:hypothetical protein